jgi:hypothetical protein
MRYPYPATFKEGLPVGFECTAPVYSWVRHQIIRAAYLISIIGHKLLLVLVLIFSFRSDGCVYGYFG